MALPPVFFAMAAVSGRGQPAAPRRRARRLPGDAAPTLRLAAGPGRQEVGGLGEVACACASRPWDPRGPQRRLGLGNPPWHCPQHSLPSAHTRAPRSHTRVHAHTHTGTDLGCPAGAALSQWKEGAAASPHAPGSASQNPGLVWGRQGHPVHPPQRAALSPAGPSCSEPRPAWPRMAPGMRHPRLSRQPVPGSRHLSTQHLSSAVPGAESLAAG